MFNVNFINRHIVFQQKDIRIEIRKGYLNEYIEEHLCVKLRLPVSFVILFFMRFRILVRLLRLSVNNFKQISSNEFIFSFKGAIYSYNRITKQILLEHKLRFKMSRPLNISKIEGLKGFDDMYVYGEYFANLTNEEVCIYGRSPLKNDWSKKYVFTEGHINHIHNIIPDKESNSVFVLTGDKDAEIFIYEFKNNFSQSRIIVEGEQYYRACNIFKIGDAFLYATDSPLQYNFIYKLDVDAKKEVLRKINGPCIYSTMWHNNWVFVTSVEPEYSDNVLKYLFTWKRSRFIERNEMVVYIGNLASGFQEVLSFKKDFWPGGLFQFANAEIVQADNELILYLVGVKKFDGYSCIIEDGKF